MKVTDTNFQLDISPSKGRSTGLHQSDVVRQIALDMGWLAAEYANAELDPNKISMGLAWEEWIERKHPEVAMHPGESEADGVSVSVDGISYQNIPVLGNDGKQLTIHGKPYALKTPIVHEIKCTWYGMPKEIEQLAEDNKFWMYRAQMMNGCKVWGTRYAKLHPFWVNGDYGWMKGRQDGVSTCYKVYEFTFEQWEIDGNWNMMMQYIKDNRGKFPQWTPNTKR